jgi:PhnB protein
MYAQTYLFLDGRTEEALDFYKKAIGAQVTAVFKFKESPDKAHIPPGSEEKVMHAEFKIGDTNIMISDGMNKGSPKFDGFALSIHTRDEAEAEKYFNALIEGGEVTMPLTESFFAKSFGMLKDKFGVHWMVIASKPM